METLFEKYESKIGRIQAELAGIESKHADALGIIKSAV